MTLTVEVEPGAVVVFQAIYSNNRSGADPPYGEGYGGNAGGRVDESGRYIATWLVRPHAPVGPGRVDVYAAVTHVGRGYAGVDFRVELPGNC